MSRTGQRSHKGLSQCQRSPKIHVLAWNVKWSERSEVTERSNVTQTVKFVCWKVKGHPKIPKVEDQPDVKGHPKRSKVISKGQRSSWNINVHSRGQILPLRVQDNWKVKSNPKIQTSLKGQRSVALCLLRDPSKEWNGQRMEWLWCHWPLNQCPVRGQAVMQGGRVRTEMQLYN